MNPSVFVLVAALASSPKPIQAPETASLNVSSAHCADARSVFGDHWSIVPSAGQSRLVNTVADVCGATVCVGVDLMTGEVTGSRRAPPIVREPPIVRDELMKAFGVVCPESDGCRALTAALKFPAERAVTFARGSGPKARWLVNEVFGDDETELTARTHVYDATTRRHLGSVLQTKVNAAPELEWVTETCALVSTPFASSEAHPKRLLCRGTHRLVSTIARHELMVPGPMASVALSDTRLAMWHVAEDMRTLRVVSLPSGKELLASELPFVSWDSAMLAGATSLFGTSTDVVLFVDTALRALYVFDPIGQRVLRGWKFAGCEPT